MFAMEEHYMFLHHDVFVHFNQLLMKQVQEVSTPDSSRPLHAN